ncbi:MAG: hypothetical protein LBC75_02600 [Fibromonadaceae bacterium]|jgi:hypothetical protein|nr:hypothetical protein [Fibromonadaceae bacterium]
MKENGQLNEVLDFIKRNKESYNSALKDKKIIDNYVSGNGFSAEALKVFEGDSNGSERVRAKVNAKFISGYVNQLKGLLIANKFDLGGDTPPSGLVAALNNSALSALGECLNYGEGFIYIDGDTFKPVSRQSIITAKCDSDDLSDCKEAVIISTKQMDSEMPQDSQLVKEMSIDSNAVFGTDKHTAIKAYHYKLKNGRLVLRVFTNDILEDELIYASEFLPISRAVCEKVLDGSKIVNRGLYIGIRDLLDQLSLDYSVIRSKVSNNPDAFAMLDKRSTADKTVAAAWDAPFGRSVLPYIGSVRGIEGEREEIPPPTILNVPFNIESLHQDIGLVKSDIQNILGFNYAAEENRGNETLEAALLRRDNSYNSKVAYIEPVAQAVAQIVKAYNGLLNTNYDVVNKVFMKVERDEKLRKIIAIAQNPQKGYEALLAKYAGFNEEEAAEIAQASGAAQMLAQTQQIMADNQRLAADNEHLQMELMNYRLDTEKTVESNKIRASVELNKAMLQFQSRMADIATKNKDIANKYELEMLKLIKEAESEIAAVVEPQISQEAT